MDGNVQWEMQKYTGYLDYFCYYFILFLSTFHPKGLDLDQYVNKQNRFLLTRRFDDGKAFVSAISSKNILNPIKRGVWSEVYNAGRGGGFTEIRSNQNKY